MKNKILKKLLNIKLTRVNAPATVSAVNPSKIAAI